MHPAYTAHQYLKHRLRCQSRHRIHSPWVYRLVTQVLPHKAQPQLVAAYRSLRRDTTPLSLPAIGTAAPRSTTVADVAKRAACFPRKAARLHRIASYVSPRCAVELGTNLGMGTSAIALGMQGGALHTLEGLPQLQEMAQHTVASCLATHPHPPQLAFHLGLFDEILPELTLQNIDFAWLDGNHTYAATLRYLEWLMPRLAEEALVVLDDIYWSPEMTRAWKAACQLAAFPVQIDLFRMGLLLKRPQARQHFVLA